jgi:hypothetical protein
MRLSFQVPQFFFSILTKTGFSRHILIQLTSIKFLQLEAEFFEVDEQSDRHDEAHSHFSLFANAPKILSVW